MRYPMEQLLSRLQELQVEFTKYEHPVVLTVESQAKYVGDVGSALSKNLFMKDKKQRFYIVSALASTKVDLKVLSQRLGLGKGGVRMAPEEALGEILQVPLGCVTPFAVINKSARQVSLLLDQGFRSQKSCIFHPLLNASIALSANDLDKFLKSVGRDPSYVDLEANPKVGKDQPPDLAAFVPSDSIDLSEISEKAPSSENTIVKNISADFKPNAVKAKAVKTSDIVKSKDKAVGLRSCISFSDPGLFAEEILDKTSALLLSELHKIIEELIKQHGWNLVVFVSDNVRKRLSSELKNFTIIFKNTAYTEGFHAGTHHQPGCR